MLREPSPAVGGGRNESDGLGSHGRSSRGLGEHCKGFWTADSRRGQSDRGRATGQRDADRGAVAEMGGTVLGAKLLDYWGRTAAGQRGKKSIRPRSAAENESSRGGPRGQSSGHRPSVWSPIVRAKFENPVEIGFRIGYDKTS